MEPATNPASTIRVIDDDDHFRKGMLRMLAASGLQAVGYRSAQDFLLCANDRIGCVLLDISMPDLCGIDLMRALRSRVPVNPVIFITARDDVMTSVEAMKQGAFDYIVKPVRAERVIPAIHRALHISEEQHSAEKDLSELRLRFAKLTDTECAVLFGIANSKLNKQIAADLGLCERAVKARRAQMMKKLRLRTVPDVIKAAKLLEDANAWAKASWQCRCRADDAYADSAHARFVRVRCQQGSKRW